MNEKQINESFKNSAIKVRIASGIALLGIVATVVGAAYGIGGNKVIPATLGVILFVGGIAMNAIAWRCPACNSPLPTRQPLKNINYCCNCGIKLK